MWHVLLTVLMLCFVDWLLSFSYCFPWIWLVPTNCTIAYFFLFINRTACVFLTDISHLNSFCFQWGRHLKAFCVNRNQSHARQTQIYAVEIKSICLLSPNCKLPVLVFLPWFMAFVLPAWAINRGGNNLVHNLQNRPQTWLVRGM